MDTEAIYEVRIDYGSSAGTWTVYMMQSDAEAARSTWVEMVEAGEVVKLLHIEGFCNTADRGVIQASFKCDEIKSLMITEMFQP